MSPTREATAQDSSRRRSHLREAAIGLALALTTGLAARSLGPGPVTIALGGFDLPYRAGPWGKALRVDLDPQASRDDRLTFYFRPLRDGGVLRLPIVPRGGPMRVAFRARAMVRSSLGAFASGVPVPEVLVDTGPWDRYVLVVPPAAARQDGLELALFLRARAVVTGEHASRPEILVDEVTVESIRGLLLAWPAVLVLAACPLAVALFARVLGQRPRAAWTGGLAAAALVLGLVRLAPLATLMAVPRLVPLALGAGLLAAFLLGRFAGSDSRTGRRWAWVMAIGLAVHGCLPFFPDHNPPDLQTHADRTLDFADVPWEYVALLRYGSHLPTASQTAAPATDLFGTHLLVPYPPLPYFVYYGLSRLGADPLWAMTAFNALLAMAVAPLLFLAARSVWDEQVGWLAAALYLLDLAVWHHVGRVHAPSSFGAALGAGALLALAAKPDHLTRAAPVLALGAALAIAVLGYSALVVQFGLFGVVLLVLLLVDAKGLPGRARAGVASALAVGALLALVLYYGHYLPGLLRGTPAVEAEPSIFTGKTVLGIFRNEGRQSYRIWMLGFTMPLLAGLAAAPLALRRARPAARPVLAAWLVAWALIMVLKDPLLFPTMLRWAKEDQFVSPLLCLFIAAGACAVRPAAVRRVAVGVVLLAALALAARDFYFHANTLWL